MKKIFLLFLLITGAGAAYTQPLFTYGNKSVDKEEFLRAYNKNKTPVDDKERSLREYLELYIKFKLKVNAALDLKLDTLPQLQYDAQSFRTQIEDSYLSNEATVNNLVTEAFTRSQKDLRVLHFFAGVAPTATPDDSLKAFRAISAAQSQLATGRTDYEKLIAETGPDLIRQSDIGFITVFTLPYEYENIVYGLKKDQVSKPYRSKNGWHVFKVIDERKAIGKWKLAQILTAVPPEQQGADKTLLAKRADSIYQLLQKGADFSLLARQVSDDKLTYGNRGELPEFGSGRYQPSFENEVLKLTRDGEISKPFLTEFGYHIIKRIMHTPVTTDKDDAAYTFELKQKILQDARVNVAKDLFLKEIQKQISFKKTGNVSDQDLFRYADSALWNADAGTGNYPISSKPIYSFGKTKITGSQWLDFVKNYKGNPQLYQQENNAALLEKFVGSITMDYYKSHLEDYNTEFKYQMQEFKDGNVLFEIMERNVWGSAAADTAALHKHYNNNKNKYLWAASADLILFNCINKTVAENAKEALKNGKDWKQIMDESGNGIQADSGRFEISQVPISIDPKSAAGFVTTITVNTQDGSAGFAKIIRQYPEGAQRTFEEAKGLVINDYQNILEETWVNELKKKYPVKINETVFKSLLK
ncbi:MAG: peptidylprolyl isomerase [Chitinophagales bacterium]|nr:peptidylprolyl isomerase [Chitinophagales bacterium]